MVEVVAIDADSKSRVVPVDEVWDAQQEVGSFGRYGVGVHDTGELVHVCARASPPQRFYQWAAHCGCYLQRPILCG